MRRVVLILLGTLIATSVSAMNVQEFLANKRLLGKTVLITGLVACMPAYERICYVFDDSDAKSLIMFDTSRLPPDHLITATRCAGECVLEVVGVVAKNQYAMTRLVATSVTRPSERNK